MKLYLCQVASPAKGAGGLAPSFDSRAQALEPTPSDAVLNFAFMANLAAQEATGDSAASTSPERVLNRLKGSTESLTLLFPVLDHTPPMAELSSLGLPLISATGELPAMNFVGYIHISLPLLEETNNAEIECVLDVEYLPLPGEKLTPRAREIADWMAVNAVNLTRKLGRNTAQVGVLFPSGGNPSFDPMGPSYRTLGFVPKHSESQLRIPIPETPPTPLLPSHISTHVWLDYGIPPGYVDGVLELLTVASTDANHGDLSVEPIVWSAKRLQQAHERLLDRRAHTLLVALVEDEVNRPNLDPVPGEILALAELSRLEHADPQVCEWTLTVTQRGKRRKGYAWAAKLAALQACVTHWPEVERSYTSVADKDVAMWTLNQRLGAEVISTSQAWELKLDKLPAHG